jgi:DNA-binding protein HU-beta
VSEELGTSKAESLRAIDAVFDSITNSLSKGNEVRLAGFGSFVVQAKPARMARNPRTGEQVKVAKKKVAKFRPATALKESVDY